MTLNDILVSALAQLDRGHDRQTLDIWEDKFTRYANEAMADLATTLQLNKTDTLDVKSRLIDLTALPSRCTKVLRVQRGFDNIPFLSGPCTTKMRVLCEDGPVFVGYRYLPNDMSSPTDVPGIPAYCHSAIITYVVARERASTHTQQGAAMYFELYNNAKRRLGVMLGQLDGYRIENRW